MNSFSLESFRHWWVGSKSKPSHEEKSQASKPDAESELATNVLINYCQRFSAKKIKEPFIESKDFELLRVCLLKGADIEAKVSFGKKTYAISEVLFYKQAGNGFGQLKVSNRVTGFTHYTSTSVFLFSYLDAVSLSQRSQEAVKIWLSLVPIAHAHQQKTPSSELFDVFERLMMYDINPFPALLEKMQEVVTGTERLMFAEHLQYQLQKEQWCSAGVQEKFDKALSQRPPEEQRIWLDSKKALGLETPWVETERVFLSQSIQHAEAAHTNKPRL